MSDILEDQKIFYIVKDYRRMYELHSELVDAIKQATKELKKKDNRIAYLERQLTKSVTTVKLTTLKDIVRRANDQFISVESHAQKGQKILEELMQVIDQVPEEEVESEEIEEDDNSL